MVVSEAAYPGSIPGGRTSLEGWIESGGQIRNPQHRGLIRIPIFRTMNDLDFVQLRTTLNRGLDFEVTKVSREGLEKASGGDLPLALLKLKEWEVCGWVKILCNPLTAAPQDECVELIDTIQ